MPRDAAPLPATATELVLNLLATLLLALAAFLLAALAVALQRGLLVAEDRDTLLMLQLLRGRVPMLYLGSAVLVLAAAWAFLRAHAAWLGRRSGFWSAQRKAAALGVLGATLAAHHALSAAGSAEGLVGGVLLGLIGLLSLGVMLGAGEPDPPSRGAATGGHAGLSVASLRPGWRMPPTRLGTTGRGRRSLR